MKWNSQVCFRIRSSRCARRVVCVCEIIYHLLLVRLGTHCMSIDPRWNDIWSPPSDWINFFFYTSPSPTLAIYILATCPISMQVHHLVVTSLLTRSSRAHVCVPKFDFLAQNGIVWPPAGIENWAAVTRNISTEEKDQSANRFREDCKYDEKERLTSWCSVPTSTPLSPRSPHSRAYNSWRNICLRQGRSGFLGHAGAQCN